MPLVVAPRQGQARWGAIGANVGWDSTEQRHALILNNTVVIDDHLVGAASTNELHLSRVPTPGAEERVQGQCRGCIIAAAHDRRTVAHGRDKTRPQCGRSPSHGGRSMRRLQESVPGQTRGDSRLYA